MKVRVLHLLYVAAGVSALGVGVWVWREVADTREEDRVEDGLADLRTESRGRERERESSGSALPPQVHRFTSASRDELARELVFTPPAAGDPLELDPEEAVDAFADVMEELEQAVDDDTKLSSEESAEYYNRATGSFTAMSSWVDGTNPRERAILNDAHARMLELMEKLDIQPPPRQVDGFARAR